MATKQSKFVMTPARKASLEKARAAAMAKKVSAPETESMPKVGLVEEVRELKALMESQFKAYNDTMDQVKLMLEDIKHNIPKKLNLDYLDK